MSKRSVLDFFQACADDAKLVGRLESKSLPELVLHAKSAGYMFSSGELTGLVGAMEVFTILNRLGEEIDAYSSLWPKMWGKSRLRYVVDELYNSFSKEELAQFLD